MTDTQMLWAYLLTPLLIPAAYFGCELVMWAFPKRKPIKQAPVLDARVVMLLQDLEDDVLSLPTQNESQRYAYQTAATFIRAARLDYQGVTDD